MLGLGLLARLAPGETVAVLAGRCLRRYRRAACTECAKKCPQGVIAVGSSGPRVTEACSGCGVCVSACPAGVFAIGSPARKTLLAATEGSEPLTLACSLGRGNRSTGRVPCLGHLDAGMLLALGAGRRPITLLVHECGRCRLGKGLDTIHEESARANAIVAALGLSPTVRLADQAQPEAGGNGGAGYSRRELFALLRGQAGRASAVALEEAGGHLAPGATRRVDVTLADHSGALFGAQVRRLAAEAGARPTGMLPLRRPVTDAQCDLCGVCVAACPGRALAVESDGLAVKMCWRAAACWQCGLCRDVCPVTALRYAEGVPASAFLEESALVVAAGSRRDCEDCGRSFVASNDDKACRHCQVDGNTRGEAADLFGLGRPT